ncbi:MAG: SDR family NAD(P)-dependent oxidoreductase, partial [Chromatocurvus sp.]
VQEQLPELPELNPEDLAELSTLGQIVDYIQARAPAAPAAPHPAPAAPVTAPGSDLAHIQGVMMTVVADKTGYPADMLEPGMDMEADLGIDSIKRVEILGSVQEQLPELPELNPEDLAELSTLGQIVDYIQARAPAAAAAAPADTGSGTAPAAASEDVEQVSRVMMAIVAEKTGYPAEMLELDMDMEADLGIDSIKRVEILGAVQEALPELPEPNPDILAEFRTLGQIIEALGHTSRFAGEAGVQQTSIHSDRPEATVAAPIVPSSTVVLQSLPAPEPQPVTLPEAPLCLITDDGGTTLKPLAEQLMGKGWTVVVMRLPKSHVGKSSRLPAGVKTVALSDMDETAVRAALEFIAENIGNVDALIYLQPKTSIESIAFSNASRERIQLAFLLAKHLKICLEDAAKGDRRAAFITVARLDGALGYSGAGNTDLVQGGLFGLTKTIQLEWPSVFCRAIDLQPDTAGKQAAQHILAEMYAPGGDPVEVGYGDQGRVTLVGQPTDSHGQAAGTAIDAESVFLVSGGAKGVTTQCVIRLAERFHSKFILLGRSPLTEEPAWADGMADEAALKQAAMAQLVAGGEKPTPVKIQQLVRPILSLREIQQSLAAIRQAGGQAEYVSVDVTDAAAIKRQIQPLVERLGRITGLIHGAGVLADKQVEKKTLAEFQSVYATKVDGLASLLAAVEPDQLSHLVLFSSAAGFYGNPGQSDYSVANEILNKTALRFKQLHPACQVLSFNWGPWDGGMVTPELKQMFAARGVYVIPLEGGAQLFVDEVGAATNRSPQILVGNDMGGTPETGGTPAEKKSLASHLSRSLRLADLPLLKQHRIGGNPVLPTVWATGWMAAAAEQGHPGYRYQGLENYHLYNGVVFDGSEADNYTLVLPVQERTAAGLLCKAGISSVDKNGRRINHYAADILLTRELLPAPTRTAPDLRQDPRLAGWNPYADGTLFHGPVLQGIRKVINCDARAMTLLCQITDPAAQAEADRQPTCWVADDLLLQAMLVWVRQHYQAGSLPSAVRRWTQYRPVPFDTPFYLTLEVTSKSDTGMVADVRLHDAQGVVFSEMHGAQVTISKRLNALFLNERSI